MKKLQRRIVCSLLMCGLALISLIPIKVVAKEMEENVPGTVFEFGSKEHYEFSDATTGKATNSDNSYGTLSIVGDVKTNGKQDGVLSFDAKSNTMSLT